MTRTDFVRREARRQTRAAATPLGYSWNDHTFEFNTSHLHRIMNREEEEKRAGFSADLPIVDLSAALELPVALGEISRADSGRNEHMQKGEAQE